MYRLIVTIIILILSCNLTAQPSAYTPADIMLVEQNQAMHTGAKAASTKFSMGIKQGGHGEIKTQTYIFLFLNWWTYLP